MNGGELHELSGFLGLFLLSLTVISGIFTFYRLYRFIPLFKPSFFLKTHKLSVGLFITLLLVHILTTSYTSWSFVIGAFLLGLSLTTTFLLYWFPSQRKILIYTKLLLLVVSLILILYGHLGAEGEFYTPEVEDD